MYRKIRKTNIVKQYTGVGPLDFPLPLDSLGITKIFYSASGFMIETYPTGTPAARQGSVINSLFPTLSLVIEGDTIKSGSPGMFRFFAGIITKIFPSIKSTVGATANRYPQTEIAGGAAVSFATTTQYFNLYEVGTLFCENVYCENDAERLQTVIRTKGLSDAYLRFEQANPSNLQDSANTAPVVYTSLNTLELRVDIEELKEDVPGELDNVKFYGQLKKFRQREKSETLTGQVAGRLYDLLGIGGQVMGITMTCNDGAAGSATTNTSKQKNDLIVTDLNFIVDDEKRVAESNWQRLKDIMRDQFRYLSPLTNSAGEDTGFSGIYWVKRRISESLDLRNSRTWRVELSSAAQATTSDYGAGGAVVRFLCDYITDK